MEIIGQTSVHLAFEEVSELLKESRQNELRYREMLASAERERQAFASLKSALLSRPEFKDKYVAVIDGKVEDSDDSDERLVARMYVKYGYRPMYIGFVSEALKREFVPTPIVRRKS